jgi:hypothetical protein
MCNELDEKIGQVAQRPPAPVVDPLSASVGCDLGCQAGQKTTERLGPVALQAEEEFELIYDPFDDLLLSRRPTTVGFVHALLESSLGVAATSAT